jgi:protein-L-isoaspartate(D-aspartate) O-methyltransferase
MPSRPLPVFLLIAAAALPACGGQPQPDNDMHASARSDMVREIADDVVATREYLGKGALDDAVMAAMGRVPRHEFVPPALQHRAYENRPLPIGRDQTISQPYIVALMTDLLDPRPGDRVLEIGTGSGYQAAVLAELVGHVYTIEIVPELGERARTTLERLGVANVTVRIGDGYLGWPEHAPFDGVIVTAAPTAVPPPLVEQLKVGGRLVIPVGEPWTGQELMVYEKRADGTLATRRVLPVAFVPLTGPNVEPR